jgi:putative transposase
MARLPRLTLAGYPHHIIQRGNNKQAIFVDAADREKLLSLLQDAAARFKVAVHSYVLMGNHFHLLATPETADGIPQAMQSVGRSYVRYFNDRHGRSGTLWEGRYKSTLVQTEKYLLTCMIYIELNPVRAGLVEDPGQYPWSSYGHYAGVRADKLVQPHPIFWELGNTPFARELGYVDLVRGGLTDEQQRVITESTVRGWALGDEAYATALQSRTERRVSKGRAGRPKLIKA